MNYFIRIVNSNDEILGGLRAYYSENQALEDTISILKAHADYDGDEQKAERRAKEFIAVNLIIFAADQGNQSFQLVYDTYCAKCYGKCTPMGKDFNKCMESVTTENLPPARFRDKEEHEKWLKRLFR